VTKGHDIAAQAASPAEARAAGGAMTRADRIRRLLRYTAVNLASLAVDYAVFLSLTHAFAIPVTASMVSYAVAFALNYHLSRRLVFAGHGTHKSERRLFTEFMASGVFGLLLTAAVTGGGIHLLGLSPTIAKTAAVLMSFVALYLIRSRLVFTRLEQSLLAPAPHVSIGPMLARLTTRSFGSLSVRVPPAAAGQRIGLLGGSFNPPHRAHVAVSEAVLKRLGLDEVWWIVTPGNPLKAHDELAPLADRLEACRRLVTNPRIRVTALEADLGSTSTIVTLSFLKRRLAGVHFVWIMGGDNLAGFHRWAAWRQIAALMPFVVADRPQWRLKALSSPAARALAPFRISDDQAGSLALKKAPAWLYLTLRLSPESSTEIRAGRYAAPVSGGGRRS
jgi:nicotinate-nucleotide adenylyltransferase